MYKGTHGKNMSFNRGIWITAEVNFLLFTTPGRNTETHSKNNSMFRRLFGISSSPIPNYALRVPSSGFSPGVASFQTPPLKKPTISSSTPGEHLKSPSLWFSHLPLGPSGDALLRINLDLLIPFDWLITSAVANIQ